MKGDVGYIVFEVQSPKRLVRRTKDSGHGTLQGARVEAHGLARKAPFREFVIYAPLIVISTSEPEFSEERLDPTWGDT